MSALDFLKRLGGGLGSVAKTNQLARGMTPEQVKDILGNPKQTQFMGDKMIWKYSLHEYFKGWVPYYLVWGDKTQALESWYADEKEYLRNQELWMKAFEISQTSAAHSASTPSAASPSLTAEIASNEAWKASGAGNWSSR